VGLRPLGQELFDGAGHRPIVGGISVGKTSVMHEHVDGSAAELDHVAAPALGEAPPVPALLLAKASTAVRARRALKHHGPRGRFAGLVAQAACFLPSFLPRPASSLEGSQAGQNGRLLKKPVRIVCFVRPKMARSRLLFVRFVRFVRPTALIRAMYTAPRYRRESFRRGSRRPGQRLSAGCRLPRRPGRGGRRRCATARG
jgi:hypothetical protein